MSERESGQRLSAWIWGSGVQYIGVGKRWPTLSVDDGSRCSFGNRLVTSYGSTVRSSSLRVVAKKGEMRGFFFSHDLEMLDARSN
jgi:hypothetical protein